MASVHTDKQTYRYKDGSEVTFHIRVDFDQIVHAIGRRARRSKAHYATALDGAVQVTAIEVAAATKGGAR